MMKYLLGNLLILAGAYAWNLLTDPILLHGPTSTLIRVTLVLLVIPMTMAAGAAMLIHRARPRRLFDVAANRLIAPTLLGFLTAVVSIVLTTLAVVFLDKFPTPNDSFDAAATGSSSFLATLAVLLLLCRRRQSGRCLRCNYDIQGSLNAGRCPECGVAF